MAHYIRLRGKNRTKIKVSPNLKVNRSTEAVVDIDNAATRRYINDHKGHFWSVPNYDIQITQQGTAVVATTNSGLVLRAPKDLVIKSVTAWSAVAPATNPIIVDVKRAGTALGTGTTIFNNAGARPTIATAAVESTGGTSFTSGASTALWSNGEYMRIEVAQVGSAPTGKDVTVQIVADLPI